MLDTIEFSSRELSMRRVASESVPGCETTTLAEVVPTAADWLRSFSFWPVAAARIVRSTCNPERGSLTPSVKLDAKAC